MVTERDEPQAVIGSSLHQLAYPDDYRKHVEAGRQAGACARALRPRRRRAASAGPRSSRSRRAANTSMPPAAKSGLRVFDIAFIDHKGFSERIVTAPVSPLGQRFFVRTTYATAVAAPTTIAPDPTRTHQPGEPRADRPRALRLSLRHGPRGGPDPRAGRHPARRQPAQQLPGPRADLQPRRHPEGRAGITIVGTYRLHLLRRRARRRVAR